MKDNHPFADEKAVEGSTDAGATARPKLKQAIAESPRVRKPKTGPVFNEQFDQARIVGENIYRPRLNGVLYPLMKVLDLEGYGLMLANMRTSIKVYHYDVQRQN